MIKPSAKAMTAIAAVLAFTSTQSFAQETTAPPDPVADTSIQTQEPADPPASEPTAAESAVTTEAAAPPAPKPKVETSRAAAPRAKPAATGSSARSTVRRASATAPAAATAATAMPAAEAAAPSPLPAEPQPPATAEPVVPVTAEPAPASITFDSLMTDLMADSTLPVAGGAALGLLALGGAGIAMRRRKRRRENEEFAARQEALATGEAEPLLDLDPADEVRPGPVFARAPAPVHDPVPDSKASANRLPNGFDLSRFGPHVQAAYRGPTPDNPSLSLKYRVRRAAALDQQERRLAEQQRSSRPAVESTPKVAVGSNWQTRSHGEFLLRRAQSSQAKRPVEQH